LGIDQEAIETVFTEIEAGQKAAPAFVSSTPEDLKPNVRNKFNAFGHYPQSDNIRLGFMMHNVTLVIPSGTGMDEDAKVDSRQIAPATSRIYVDPLFGGYPIVPLQDKSTRNYISLEYEIEVYDTKNDKLLENPLQLKVRIDFVEIDAEETYEF